MTTELIQNIDRLHTTPLGIIRIQQNLSMKTDDMAAWCKVQIQKEQALITRNGKNWYIEIDDNIFTVNASSYTIITAHKRK
ncbi:DUF3781 domain-containing protein [Clostridiaceae bacterium DONG20-135]|uniref:DUF3781 domain-containing protein n=1 Tax=Copranaerobaculum intestinale TaxID=2692629 RepID=A0A6N8U6V3_9FIRM|nr:DUF3781 domain-containing protein [Copranaerobaculum intestinale]MXQ73621.1 DUF3781 domain-containing protein [Copranaerobaculum intestinale]